MKIQCLGLVVLEFPTAGDWESAREVKVIT